VVNKSRGHLDNFEAPPRVVTLLLRTMGLGLSMELKISKSIDESDRMEIIRKSLSGPF
jgi:hypothetical protein